MASFSSSQPLTQLKAVCERHPLERKVVFVPHTQAGQTLLTGLARYGGSWIGLQCTTPLHYAQSIARWYFRKKRLQPLSLADVPFLVAAIVDDLPEASLRGDLPHTQYVSRMIAHAISTLRENGITSDALRKQADAPSTTPIMHLLETCYRRYNEELGVNDIYDDASVLKAATSLLREGCLPDVDQTVYAIFDTTALPHLTCELINSVREKGLAFYRIGSSSHQEHAPPHTAASYFRDTPGIHNDYASATKRQVTTRRAAGVQNEIDGIFQYIVNEGLQLDQVEIAYTSVQPYLSLLSTRADALSIPLRFSAGQPSLQTLTGQALHGFYDWIQEDFDVAILIRMLRSGLFRVDKVQQNASAKHQFSSSELATFLASRSYEPGRTGYQKAFRIAREQIVSSKEHAENRDISTEHEEQKLRILERAESVVSRLLSLSPRTCDLSTFAQKSLAFVESFGPIDPSQHDEEHRDFEEAARQVIYQKLEKLTHTPVEYRTSARRLAHMFSEALQHQFVRSEQPKEGAASVVPLDSAGYSGRHHLFVVGTDGETLSWPSMDDALLRDADRVALAEDLDVEMAASRGAADEAMWRIEQALARHKGDLHLYANVFDVESGEARFPSALFLENEHDNQPTNVLGFVPGDSAQLLLDEASGWIEARALVTKLSETPRSRARDVLADKYPFIGHGEFASQQMASDKYTMYDGLLRNAMYPDLDIRGGQTLSTDRLEMLSESPYAYFLKYILDVAPLDEPALDDDAWMSMLRRGNILHRTFERFMRAMGLEPVTLNHENELLQMLELEIEAEKRKVGPPSERIEASARRMLQADSRVFLKAEASRPADTVPRMHEVGFDTSPRWRRNDDFGPVRLTFENGTSIRLRGRIDRVDEVQGRGLSILDYKTGSANHYSESDPLTKGAHLQWALYAYALEELTDKQVVRSEYFFASTREMGLRIQAAPALYRRQIGELLHTVGEMARNGCFPMAPGPRDAGPWKWGGFDRLFHDLKERGTQLSEKRFPEERKPPLFVEQE